MHRKPYDPATSGPQALVHDRRPKDINRGSAGHIVETEVDDPYEAGAKISAVRSIRDDPLAWHLSRGHIDRAQFEAGRQFQKYFQLAERGPRAIQLVEAVDGGLPPEALTDAQIKAQKWLAKAYRALGQDGTLLIHEMLIYSMTAKRVAASRGMTGAAWEMYTARRFYECLNRLAVVYGFASARGA